MVSRTVCAWCKAVIAIHNPVGEVSHGICLACAIEIAPCVIAAKLEKDLIRQRIDNLKVEIPLCS